MTIDVVERLYKFNISIINILSIDEMFILFRTFRISQELYHKIRFVIIFNIQLILL